MVAGRVNAKTPPATPAELNCTPSLAASRGARALDYIVPPDASTWPVNCESNEELCKVVRRTAINREVIVAVCNSAVKAQLSKWVDANQRAGIKNMLIISIDNKLPGWLDENGVAYWLQADAALGSHKISAQKFKYVRAFLSIGCSVLMSDIDVVYLQNPFLFLHKDSDVEGTTDGWDDESAYGWMEQLDDPSLGAFGRFRPAMRITAWNSGLWYARATHASLRLMSILAYRMEHEPNTWDQAAFGEEVTRPARDDHMAAGLAKRALSYWCFANSKTVFRRMKVEPELAHHRPVVVHANYHQPKEPRMRAVYKRWHLDEQDALNEWSFEPTGVVPAPVLEKDFLHVINDGFVSGSDMRNARAAVRQAQCKPLASKHGLAMQLHTLPLSACVAPEAVCAAAARAAARGKTVSARRELLLLIGGSAHAAEMELLLKSAKAAGVSNILLLAVDDQLLPALGAFADDVGVRLSAEDASERGLLLLKWRTVEQLVASGYGVLFLDAATVLVSDPFDALYRDADIEAMTMGWDDPSSYGYNHVIDDPSMGFTRYCHGSRIVGYEPRAFFANPTTEAKALAKRMQEDLSRKLSSESIAWEAVRAEREAFLEELWMPSHRGFTSTGAVLRVLNYLCFVNSKVMFRQLRGGSLGGESRPVLVTMSYHSDAAQRMQAVYEYYHESSPDLLRKLPNADATGDPTHQRSPPGCDGSRAWRESAAASPLSQRVVAESPFAWGGVAGFEFAPGGELRTPWGGGQWGIHEDSADTLFADFVGAKHNVQLSHGVAISTRCNDNNVVLLRSVKNANLRK